MYHVYQALVGPKTDQSPFLVLLNDIHKLSILFEFIENYLYLCFKNRLK